MISTSLLQYELQQTSAVFGRNGRVHVVFEGDEARTDGNTIQLPAMPQNAEISDEGAQVIRGFLDHEAGHVRHTDMAKTKEVMTECEHKGRQPLFRIANGLEDIRTEREVIADYPGSIKNLRAVGDAVAKRFLEGHREGHIEADDLRDLSKIGPLAVTWVGRKDYGAESFGQCLDLLPEDVRKTVEDWHDRLGSCRSTADVLALAEQIYKEIGSPEEEPNEDFDPDSTDGDGDGERELGPYGDLFKDAGAAEVLKTTFAESDIDPGAYRPLSTRWDVEPDRHNPGYYKDTWSRFTAQDYDTMRDGMAGQVNAMRTRLERALLAEQRRDWDFGRSMGRIDAKRFVSVLAGRENVYKDREDRKEIDTAVSMLIDLSGSMRGQKQQTAARCAVALVESLVRTGVSFEVLGFHNWDHIAFGQMADPREQAKAERAWRDVYDKALESGECWGRVEPMVMPIFKSFDERLHEAKPLLAAISETEGGNNADGDALQAAVNRLKKRHESRKVMLVLSDGEPAAATINEPRDILDDHLRHVIGQTEASGIRTVGIGIMSHAVKRYYPRHVVVRNLEDLAGTTIDMLAQLLIGKSVRPVA